VPSSISAQAVSLQFARIVSLKTTPPSGGGQLATPARIDVTLRDGYDRELSVRLTGAQAKLLSPGAGPLSQTQKSQLGQALGFEKERRIADWIRASTSDAEGDERCDALNDERVHPVELGTLSVEQAQALLSKQVSRGLQLTSRNAVAGYVEDVARLDDQGKAHPVELEPMSDIPAEYRGVVAGFASSPGAVHVASWLTDSARNAGCELELTGQLTSLRGLRFAASGTPDQIQDFHRQANLLQAMGGKRLLAEPRMPCDKYFFCFDDDSEASSDESPFEVAPPTLSLEAPPVRKALPAPL
jgi:hypothetical protein